MRLKNVKSTSDLTVKHNKQKVNQIVDTVRLVPAGKVASYGLIADLAGLPGRARMVGSVLRQTPVDVVVPWYRILRSNGQIAFPAGSAQAERQRGLLQEEGVVVINNRVDLKRFGWTPELADLMQMNY
jgi:methylated-DNA-protein-cysteine methyltransferase-like protein